MGAIDDDFLPLAEDLVRDTFGTTVTWTTGDQAPAYDPATGVVTATPTTQELVVAIVKRSRTEGGGTEDTEKITIWVQHGAQGLAHRPNSSDSFVYDGITWRVLDADPTFSADNLIASKVEARAN